ncbi:GCC2 and GCC3 domain-containing protein [Besnoitia besnoiti]|uniref:GCC2 and GCC3 domain-containing protein n=1 Tax=Besnoitia besnoiti TaxID=94643 RepID=A0A2A9M7V9_BESBE|nr:GCC2 and GCC3 domain-containing protein [Besnoitia besnoiti]PFH31737.1 GCC2 and GCC3 domain-containing protein [Besnoitia besnoiti]
MTSREPPEAPEAPRPLCDDFASFCKKRATLSPSNSGVQSACALRTAKRPADSGLSPSQLASFVLGRRAARGKAALRLPMSTFAVFVLSSFGLGGSGFATAATANGQPFLSTPADTPGFDLRKAEAAAPPLEGKSGGLVFSLTKPQPGTKPAERGREGEHREGKTEHENSQTHHADVHANKNAASQGSGAALEETMSRKTADLLRPEEEPQTTAIPARTPDMVATSSTGTSSPPGFEPLAETADASESRKSPDSPPEALRAPRTAFAGLTQSNDTAAAAPSPLLPPSRSLFRAFARLVRSPKCAVLPGSSGAISFCPRPRREGLPDTRDRLKGANAGDAKEIPSRCVQHTAQKPSSAFRSRGSQYSTVRLPSLRTFLEVRIAFFLLTPFFSSRLAGWRVMSRLSQASKNAPSLLPLSPHPQPPRGGCSLLERAPSMRLRALLSLSLSRLSRSILSLLGFSRLESTVDEALPAPSEDAAGAGLRRDSARPLATNARQGRFLSLELPPPSNAYSPEACGDGKGIAGEEGETFLDFQTANDTGPRTRARDPRACGATPRTPRASEELTQPVIFFERLAFFIPVTEKQPAPDEAARSYVVELKAKLDRPLSRDLPDAFRMELTCGSGSGEAPPEDGADAWTAASLSIGRILREETGRRRGTQGFEVRCRLTARRASPSAQPLNIWGEDDDLPQLVPGNILTVVVGGRQCPPGLLEAADGAGACVPCDPKGDCHSLGTKWSNFQGEGDSAETGDERFSRLLKVAAEYEPVSGTLWGDPFPLRGPLCAVGTYMSGRAAPYCRISCKLLYRQDTKPAPSMQFPGLFLIEDEPTDTMDLHLELQELALFRCGEGSFTWPSLAACFPALQGFEVRRVDDFEAASQMPPADYLRMTFEYAYTDCDAGWNNTYPADPANACKPFSQYAGIVQMTGTWSVPVDYSCAEGSISRKDFFHSPRCYPVPMNRAAAGAKDPAVTEPVICESEGRFRPPGMKGQECLAFVGGAYAASTGTHMYLRDMPGKPFHRGPSASGPARLCDTYRLECSPHGDFPVLDFYANLFAKQPTTAHAGHFQPAGVDRDPAGQPPCPLGANCPAAEIQNGHPRIPLPYSLTATGPIRSRRGKSAREELPLGRGVDLSDPETLTDVWIYKPGAEAPEYCCHGCHCETTNESVHLHRVPAGTFRGRRMASGQMPTYHACSPGHFCPAAAVFETPCPKRTYQPASGQGACLPIPPGFAGTGLGSVTPVACPQGHFCSQEPKRPEVSPCPAGTINEGAAGESAETACQPCPGGYTCPKGTGGRNRPGYCPLGFYCEAGKATPTPCPEGTYAPYSVPTPQMTRVGKCRRCPEGKNCPPGSSLKDVLATGICPPGAYCPGGDPARAQKCPIGTYGVTPGNQEPADCLPCDAGKYCPVTGPDDPELPTKALDCPEGSFSTNLGVVGDSSRILASEWGFEPGFHLAFTTAGGGLCRAETEELSTIANVREADGRGLPADSLAYLVGGDNLFWVVSEEGRAAFSGDNMYSFKPINLPSGARLLGYVNGRLWAGHPSERGLTVSLDHGRSFARVLPERLSSAVVFAADPGGGTLCVADAYGAVHCSTDNFASLKASSGAPVGSGAVRALAILRGGRRVLVAVEGSLYKSSDWGATFRHVATVDTAFVAIAETRLGEEVFAVSQSAVLKSENRGSSFLVIADPRSFPDAFLPIASLGVFETAADGQRKLILRGEGKRLFMRSDDGAVWEQLPRLPDGPCRAFPATSAFVASHRAPPAIEGTSGQCIRGSLPGETTTLLSQPGEMIENSIVVPCKAGHYCPSACDEKNQVVLPCPPGRSASLASIESPVWARIRALEDTTAPRQLRPRLSAERALTTRSFTRQLQRPAFRRQRVTSSTWKALRSRARSAPSTDTARRGRATRGSLAPGDFPRFCRLLVHFNSHGLRRFTGGASVADCFPCPAGYFCPGVSSGGSLAPVECTVGHYCPAGSAGPTKCPPGTMNLSKRVPSVEECELCPRGSYCSGTSALVVTGSCDAGFLCVGGATDPRPNDGVTGSPCPAGGYCPVGTLVVQPCPAGRYNPTEGAESEAACQPCPEGFFCLGSGNSAPDGVCSPGYYCPEGSSRATQKKAEVGYYAEAGAAVQTPCEPGTYAPEPGMASCLACPAGTLCADAQMSGPAECPQGSFCLAGVSKGSPCPAGTFGPRAGLRAWTECKVCPPGQFCGAAGLTRASGPCAGGYYCVQAATSAAPALAIGDSLVEEVSGPCPAGFFCRAGAITPTPCPQGTFNRNEKSDSDAACIQCTAGFFCDRPGLAEPAGRCPEGYACPLGSRVAREPSRLCPKGFFCPEGAAEAQPCPAGTYADVAGSPACQPCPSGFLCSAESADFSTPCPEGHYCPRQSTDALECPAGTVGPGTKAPNSSACLQCPPGAYCETPGRATPTAVCPAGAFCAGGVTSAGEAVECPAGAYCPQGTAVPIACPRGQFCQGPGRDKPSGTCQAASYCPAGTQTPEGLACPRGSFCLGQSDPVPCPPGTYSDVEGLSAEDQCKKCPPGSYCSSPGLAAPSGLCAGGYFCEEGAADPRPVAQVCPPGHMCPQGVTEPAPCPVNTWQPLKGQTECQVCPAGFLCDAQGARPCDEGSYCDGVDGTKKDCPEGTFQPLPGQTSELSCLPCKHGFICETPALTRPTDQCPAGHFCRGAQRTACPEGFFCPEGTEKPFPCPPGQFCAGTGLAKPSGPCAAGHYCAREATERNPSGDLDIEFCFSALTSGECPVGYYCPEGVLFPVRCPPGTFSDAPGKGELADCRPCTEGFYCGGFALTGVSGPCLPGSYCPAGQRTSYGVPCPRGHMCPAQAAAPTACPEGEYQPAEGQAKCLPCVPGFKCPERSFEVQACLAGHFCAQGVAVKCPAGTYSAAIGIWEPSQCKPCPPGKICSAAGAEDLQGATDCPEGHYCRLGASEVPSQDPTTCGPDPTACLPGAKCPAGYYCPTGSSGPIPCPQGTTGSPQGSTAPSQCIQCPAGSYCSKAGASGEPCDPGFFCVPGSTEARPVTGVCPKGKYCEQGSAEGTDCPPGTYADVEGLAACRQCPPGFVCAMPGLTEGDKTPCPVGHYCEQGTHTPEKCPSGTFSSATHATDVSWCSPCSPGHFCDDAGLQTPKGECEAGYFCLQGAMEARPPSADPPGWNGECPPGYYCPAGSSAPKACPPGTYSDTPLGTDADACQPCPEGRFCGKYGLVDPEGVCDDGFYCGAGQTSKRPVGTATGGMCPPGHFCTEGVKAACPEHSYMDEKGASSCKPCPEGHFCKASAVAPQRCPATFFCETGRGKKVCPDGSYSVSAGLSAASQCLECPPTKYCAQGKIQALCKEGFICLLGVGPTDSPPGTAAHDGPLPQYAVQLGEPCPVGVYCPAGTAEPLRCPPAPRRRARARRRSPSVCGAELASTAPP